MKTLTILLAVSVTGLLATASVLAQGRINFANSSATPLRIQGFGGPLLVLGTASTATYGIGPASVEIRLFAGLTSSSLSPVLIGTAANAPFVLNTASSIASAQGTFPGGSNLALAGFDGSVPVFLQFTAHAINGFFDNQSPIIQVNLATGVATATQVFNVSGGPNAWNGLIVGIPEPSSLALVGISFSLMFLARRRR